MYKKYSNFNFQQKYNNKIDILNLKYYNNMLFLIKIKQLLIKKKITLTLDQYLMINQLYFYI